MSTLTFCSGEKGYTISEMVAQTGNCAIQEIELRGRSSRLRLHLPKLAKVHGPCCVIQPVHTQIPLCVYQY
jgi:hypothetical protein